MGAVFFVGFMLFLLGCGVIMLMLGLVFAFVRRRARQKGVFKKCHTVLMIVFLALSVLLCLLPLAFFLWLLVGNLKN